LSYVMGIFYSMIKEDLQTAFLEKKVGKILVPGPRGTFPSEGEFLCAFNELKSQKTERKYSISTFPKRQGNQLQQGDKITEIKFRKQLDTNHSIELIINFQATLRMTLDGSKPHSYSFSYSAPSINLQETLKNLDEFVEQFPQLLKEIEAEKTEQAKKAKLMEMTNLSIRTTVSQILSSTPYHWDLIEKGDHYSLRIAMDFKKFFEFTLNSRNASKRLSQLPGIITQIENLFHTLPFPIDITMSKQFIIL